MSGLKRVLYIYTMRLNAFNYRNETRIEIQGRSGQIWVKLGEFGRTQAESGELRRNHNHPMPARERSLPDIRNTFSRISN